MTSIDVTYIRDEGQIRKGRSKPPNIWSSLSPSHCGYHPPASPSGLHFQTCTCRFVACCRIPAGERLGESCEKQRALYMIARGFFRNLGGNIQLTALRCNLFSPGTGRRASNCMWKARVKPQNMHFYRARCSQLWWVLLYWRRRRTKINKIK